MKPNDMMQITTHSRCAVIPNFLIYPIFFIAVIDSLNQAPTSSIGC